MTGLAAVGEVERLIVRSMTILRPWMWLMVNRDGVIASGKTFTRAGADRAFDRAVIERTSARRPR